VQDMTTVMFNKNKIDDFVKAVGKQYNKRKIDKFNYWDLLDKCEKLYGEKVYLIPHFNLERTRVTYVEVNNIDELSSYNITIKEE